MKMSLGREISGSFEDLYEHAEKELTRVEEELEAALLSKKVVEDECAELRRRVEGDRALEAEKRADEYGRFITAAGYIADVVVFSPDDFSEILERLKNFRIEADKLRERLQFDPGGSDRIDELEMATNMLRARAEAAEQRAEAAEADLSALAATVGAAVVASALAPGESLSAPPQHIIVSQVNRLRARAEAAEAEAERLRSAIAETLRLADIYAGVAAHNAEAEPETAGEAWRSPYMATMRELRRALGGAA